MTKAVGAESLTARAYSLLYRAIVRAECAPGSKLKIDELKQRFGIGAGPLREALSLLTSAGLVDRIDQRGFRVAPVTRAEFDDILRSRCWLEGRCLGESIRNGSREWEERLVLAQYRLSRIAREQVPTLVSEDWEVAHKEYHMALISGCDSPILLDMCDRLYDRNIRYRAISGRVAYPARNVVDEHAAIAEAVLERDEEKAVELLVAHYMRTSAFLRLPVGAPATEAGSGGGRGKAEPEPGRAEAQPRPASALPEAPDPVEPGRLTTGGPVS